jgi:hypothetical protein
VQNLIHAYIILVYYLQDPKMIPVSEITERWAQGRGVFEGRALRTLDYHARYEAYGLLRKHHMLEIWAEG